MVTPELFAAEEYFRSTLGNVDEPTAPFGLLDVQGDGRRIETAQKEFDPILTAQIHKCAAGFDVDVAAIFHSAWALVLAHICGRDDGVFGSVLNGSESLEQALGVSASVLPIRFQLRGITIAQLVRQTQQSLTDLLKYVHTPLKVALRCSGIIGSVPLFTTLLNYKGREDDDGYPKYPITVTVDGSSERFVLTTQGDVRIDIHRLMGLVSAAVQSFVDALDQMPEQPAASLVRKLDAFASEQYEPPQGEIEEVLAEIWRDLLWVDRVDRHDNFFELGGHSLLIVQMMERLRGVGLIADVGSVFMSPTLADLARTLSPEGVVQAEVPPNLVSAHCTEITPQMLPLVELEAEHIKRIVRTVPGGVANVQDIYPLTPLQEGILFHYLRNETGIDTYERPMLLSVRSRETLEDFIQALQGVIDRHDALRTAVLWDQLSQPIQVVYRQATLPVEVLTLDGERDPIEQLKQMRLERQDLRVAPLMRLHITADPHGEQWYCLLLLHHITSDHQTLDAVFSEVLAHMQGRAQSLPESVPYRNHVALALAHARAHDAEAFFRSKLADVDETTAPFGLSDVHADGTQIEETSEELEPELAEHIRSQSRRLGVSTATLLHAAWGLVLAHTSGRDDVVFGSVLLGRLHSIAGSQRILGMFINTLPLRLKLRNVTAKELVDQTQRELTELLNHEQASLAVAQRCSGTIGSAPLFAAVLNYRRSSVDRESELARAAGVRVLARRDWTNYPVLISVDDVGEKLTLTAQTDRRIAPHRMTGYLRTALQSLVDALEQESRALALSLSTLPDSERHQVVERFNATQMPYAREKLIHELFQEQVQRTPNSVAVMHGDERLTYVELNGRANQLAHYLRQKGVGPDRLVGLCVGRSLEMIVSLLAILKAGGAYVPLDPSYPTERLKYMLEDASPCVLIVQRELNNSLPGSVANVIAVDGDWTDVSYQPTENLDPRTLGLRSDHLAYVIYTSGSTGLPKGVMIEHRGVINYLCTARACYRPDAGSVVSSSLSFDATVTSLLVPLIQGSSVRLLSEGHELDGLTQQIHAGFNGLIKITPAHLELLGQQLLSEGTSSAVGVFVIGGEALMPSTVQLWKRLQPGARLINEYGPTETVVGCSTYEVLDGASLGTSVPIGTPISNAQIYILDASLQPVPIGVAGEIYIGGAGVARGYLNRPDLTTTRFLPDVFSAEPNARMYKTGDVGRWRADGVIEYLGRNDDQVKIRGFRIEPGEIETQLIRHSRIKEVVVVAREDAADEKRLVAYIVPRDSSDVSIEELRACLEEVLPEYMIPSAFVMLQNLPLTPNGKLDRRALPAPEIGAYVSGKYDEAQGEIEERVASIWRELLGVERIGRIDHFFELGGHSLLVLKLLFNIHRSFGKSLKVSDVYKHPTLRELASLICGDATTDELVDLSLEATLSDEIQVKTGHRRVLGGAVLLTGSTGFVGRFLLVQLLQNTSTKVVCLIKARSQQQAMQRLKTTLLKWNLWDNDFEQRLEVIPGDLSMPRFGLDGEAYQALSENIDSIYHCATSMNHLETYAMAKPTNVEGMRELLKLATRHRAKLINYVSTLSVFGASGLHGPRTVDEASLIDLERHSSSHGYTASKWVGEKLCMIANERGVPCNIFRLGLVWADTRQGRYDELQREHRIFKSCLTSGYGIKQYRYDMAPTPVDYVARAVVFLANKYSDGNGIFHISSSCQTVNGVFERCNEIFNTLLDLRSFDKWVYEVRRLHAEGHAMPVLPLLESDFFSGAQSRYERNSDVAPTYTHFDCTRTHAELSEAGISTPVFNDSLLRVFLEDLFARDEEVRECLTRKKIKFAIRRYA
jgi:amino acid adenylation domain-containing protein/thioester reductase-like protein